LSEQLGSLQITEEASERTTEYTDKMLTALVLAKRAMNRQDCQKTWSLIQDGLIGTEQNLRTSGEEWDYS